jgi:hypothetical protein
VCRTNTLEKIMTRQMWTYKGIDVFPETTFNSAGLRWYAYHPTGRLRAGTKAGMRQLITEAEKKKT